VHIESALPFWLVLPLVALAVFVVWILYYRNQQDAVLPRPVRIILSVSRFLVLIIIGLLIISPWIRTTLNRQIKPWFVIASDNSVSMPPVGDKTSFTGSRLKLVNDLNNNLEDRFQVKNIQFGSKISDSFDGSFSDPVTDPAQLFDYLKLFSQTHDLGGVFLTTDGVATRGVTFPEAASDFPFPVIILASGDSAQFPDVRIQEVVNNEWVRKNSNFPVRIYYNVGDYTGKNFKLQVLGPKGVIDEKVIQTTAQTSPFAEFLLQAPEQGAMQLIARIIPEPLDKNQDNNSKGFNVKVIEREGEVLCLYDAAHPDVDAIVQALKGTNSLNVKAIDASGFSGSDKPYDLVILHGLPSQKHPLGELLQKLADKQTPILFIIGKSTDPVLFNLINHGMILNNRRRSEEASRGVLNPSFTLFTLPSDFSSHLNTWPPLDLSFEIFKLNPGSQFLMTQKILSIELSDPLVAFANTRGIKYGFLCGEGIWLWRLHEFLEQKNHDYFDEWLSRSVQYLITDEKKDKFTITVPEEIFAFSPVKINGHLVNNSLEPINDPDVLFTVTDSIGQKTEFSMGRLNNYYELNINGFAPGIYRYSAETKLGNEALKREGLLTMINRPVEQSTPMADYAGLRYVASSTGGRFFGPQSQSELLSYMSKLNPADIKISKEFKWYDLINFKWLLPLLLVLLSLEWFLRRWFGIR
jgi:hypothetical protein